MKFEDWDGKPVVDREGSKIGTIEDFIDHIDERVRQLFRDRVHPW